MNIDITERKRAEEALRNTQAILQAAMDQSQAGIAIADAPSGALRYVNDAGLLIRGGDRQTIVNGVGIDQYVASWNMLDFDGNPFKSDEVPLARAILFGETCSREFIVRRTSDDDRIVLAKAAPIRDNQGNVVAGIVIFMDITERKRDEEALRKANEALAEADRRKDEFLAMLAHELRNPLEPIRCSVHIMRQLAPTMPTLFKQQDMIDRQVTHMARLIDDLLDVSRITRGTIRLKRNKLDLREAIGNAIESGLPRITQQKLQLRYQNPPSPVWVEGDITRLEQILGNLLGNAAKFTDADGQIEVRLGVEPAGRDQPAPMATLRVRDTGVGIAPEMLPRIFDLFVQADQSLDRTRGGLGIGLTMVKRLVEMHGGRIEVRSEGLGQGSEFIVRLPLVLNDQPPLAQQPLEPKARAKNRILVVDDIPDAAQSLADLLTLWGHEVAIAFNGAQAVESARRFRPDVVLLDIGLPGENGYQVARRLREEAGLTTAKLIAVTGYGRDEDFDQSKDAGFALHLTKPVDLKILQNIL